MRNLKVVFLFILTFIACEFLISCQDGESASQLRLVGESEQIVSTDNGEMRIGYKIGNTSFRLLTLKINENNLAFGADPDVINSSPEICPIGVNIVSLSDIPEKKYANSSYPFSREITIQNTGGYLIRVAGRYPNTNERVQWVIKLLVYDLTETSCRIKYAVYADRLGPTLARDNEVPKDDLETGENPGSGNEEPGNNPGNGNEEPGNNPGSGNEEPGNNPGSGNEEPGNNPGSGNEKPGNNDEETSKYEFLTEGDKDYANSADMFTFKGEGIDVSITGDDSSIIKSPYEDALNQKVFRIVSNTYGTSPKLLIQKIGNSQEVKWDYLGKNIDLNKIKYKGYSLAGFETSDSGPLKEGSYLLRIKRSYIDGSKYWIVPLVIKLNSALDMTISYRMYQLE